jgi:L-xylulokinase
MPWVYTTATGGILSYLLGLDVGQTKVKAAVFTPEGGEIAAASDSTSCLPDMGKLWKTTALLLRKVIGGIAPGEIAGIGVSGHGNGMYPLDKKGQVFTNAVLSTDQRAQSIVEEWDKTGKSAQAARYTVQRLWAGQPLPILEWFKRNKPEIWSNIGTVLFCKDFINYMLCRNYSTDYSDVSAGGAFDNVNRSYEPELFSIYGLENLFPPVIKSTGIAGRVSKAAAEETSLSEGTLVAGGSFDAAASALGAGAWEDYSVTAGTWSINAAFMDTCVVDENILQCIVAGDGEHWFAVESSPTSAVNLDWYVKNIRPLSYQQCDEIAGRYNHNDCQGIYLPYVYPMPRYPALKGGFFGDFSDDNEKLRGLYEGIAFGHRFHLENLRKAGINRNTVRLSGGLSASAVWCQILADALQLPVETAGVKNEGCFGAALAAGVAASLYPSLKEAASAPAKGRAYLPQCSYEQKYKRFKEKIEESYAGNP